MWSDIVLFIYRSSVVNYSKIQNREHTYDITAVLVTFNSFKYYSVLSDVLPPAVEVVNVITTIQSKNIQPRNNTYTV